MVLRVFNEVQVVVEPTLSFAVSPVCFRCQIMMDNMNMTASASSPGRTYRYFTGTPMYVVQYFAASVVVCLVAYLRCPARYPFGWGAWHTAMRRLLRSVLWLTSLGWLVVQVLATPTSRSRGRR